jgi:hypothetical protein
MDSNLPQNLTGPKGAFTRSKIVNKICMERA